MFKVKVPTQNHKLATYEDRQIHCLCHNGGKVLHYFQRIGKYGPVYVCSCCGAEKTVTA